MSLYHPSNPREPSPGKDHLLLPNLLITGVKKAGTTSLYEYLAQHPDVYPGKSKCTDFLATLRRDGQPPSMSEYATHFAGWRSERYRLEAPSSSLYGGRQLAEVVDQLLSHPTVVVSLRDPVTRLWSEYLMKRRDGHPQLRGLTFEDYVDACEQASRHVDKIGTQQFAAVTRGMYVYCVTDWFEVFGDRMRVVFFEQWSSDPSFQLRRLCDWLRVDPQPVDLFDVSARNRKVEYRSSTLTRRSVNAYRYVRRHLPASDRLKPFLVRAHNTLNAVPSNHTIEPQTRQRLVELFRPSNEALADVLTARGYDELPGWLASPA